MQERIRRDEFYSIICEGGVQWLVDTEGNKVPGQVWSRVTDNMDDEIPYVIVKLLVNIGFEEKK